MSTDLSALLKQLVTELTKPQASSTGSANSANGTQTDNGIINQGEDKEDSVTIGGQEKGLGDGAIPDLDDNKGVMAFFAMILSAIVDTIKGLTDSVAEIAENQIEATQQTQQANNTNQTTTNNTPATTTNATNTNAAATKPKHEDGEFVTHDMPNKGETTKETYKNGVLVSKKITNGNITQEFKYDSSGKWPGMWTEQIKKDSNGTRIEKREFNEDGTLKKEAVTYTDGTQKVLEYYYTKTENGVTTRKAKATFLDKNGKITKTQFVYETLDSKHRVTSRKFYDENDENIEYEENIKYDGDSTNRKETNITGYKTDSKTGKSVVDYTEKRTNYKYESGKSTYDYERKDSKGNVTEKGNGTFTTKEVRIATTNNTDSSKTIKKTDSSKNKIGQTNGFIPPEGSAILIGGGNGGGGGNDGGGSDDNWWNTPDGVAYYDSLDNNAKYGLFGCGDPYYNI